MKTIRLKVKVHYKMEKDTSKPTTIDKTSVDGDSFTQLHTTVTPPEQVQTPDNIGSGIAVSKSNFDRFVELVGDTIVTILGLNPSTVSDESLEKSIDTISNLIDGIYGLNTYIRTEQKLPVYYKDLANSPVENLLRVGACTREYLSQPSFINPSSARALELNIAAESACYSIFKEIIRLTESVISHINYKKLAVILLPKSFSSRAAHLNYLFEASDQTEDKFGQECIYGWFYKLSHLIGTEICEILNLWENTYTEYHYHKVYNMIHAVLVSEFPITMEFYREGDSRSPVEDITILNKLTLFYHITSPDLCDSNLKYQNSGPGLAIYTIISDAFRLQIDSDTDGILGLLLKDPTHSKDPKLIRIALKAPKKRITDKG